ncbi:hypothetical protein L6452_21764 [Arctium lappa]|uniref:Uncharacterized protein n=1 Tax=Arctium lappa TaxID=4217 RepID=A0ACB9AYS5_ARCLA|nr:hypothetical protein L6452_21764 [Arctium lappa]
MSVHAARMFNETLAVYSYIRLENEMSDVLADIFAEDNTYGELSGNAPDNVRYDRDDVNPTKVHNVNELVCTSTKFVVDDDEDEENEAEYEDEQEDVLVDSDSD